MIGNLCNPGRTAPWFPGGKCSACNQRTCKLDHARALVRVVAGNGQPRGHLQFSRRVHGSLETQGGATSRWPHRSLCPSCRPRYSNWDRGCRYGYRVRHNTTRHRCLQIALVRARGLPQRPQQGLSKSPCEWWVDSWWSLTNACRENTAADCRGEGYCGENFRSFQGGCGMIRRHGGLAWRGSPGPFFQDLFAAAG